MPNLSDIIPSGGGGGSSAWGGITGTLTAQTDLQSALDAKFAYTDGLSELPGGSYAYRDIYNLASDEVDDRLTGVTAGAAAQDIFSTRNDGSSTYVRSTTWFGAGIDLTCVSVYASGAAGDSRHTATAISPRHVLLANHFYTAGETYRFVTAAGVVVSRTLSSSAQIGSTDMRIGLLDSDLPATITPARVLVTNQSASLSGAPLLIIDQLFRAYIHNLSGTPDDDISIVAASTGVRVPFAKSGGFVTGDSSHPAFLILDDTPVILFVLHGSANGPGVTHHYASINAAMTSLGGGHQLSPMPVSTISERALALPAGISSVNVLGAQLVIEPGYLSVVAPSGIQFVTINTEEGGEAIRFADGLTEINPTTGAITVPTEAYDAGGWNGDMTVPTKDAIRDKIETLQPLDADLTTWAGITPGTNVGALLADFTLANFNTALSDADVPALGTSNTYTAGAKQIFTGSAANAPINIGSLASNPSSLATGDLWLDVSTTSLRYRSDGGVTHSAATDSNTLTLSNKTLASPVVSNATASTLAKYNGSKVLGSATDGTDYISPTTGPSITGGTLNPSQYLEAFDDFVYSNAARLFNGGSTGGSTPVATNSSAAHPGVYVLSTSTSASGASYMNDANSIVWVFGGGAILYESLLMLPTLSDGTETYTVRAGWNDSNTADGADGLYFRYTHSVNSGNWQLVARNNSVETATNAATGPAASTWYRMRILVAADGLSAEGFVNGTSIGTVASNIPVTDARATGMFTGIVKSAGTTARTMQCDYIWLRKVFSTPR